MENPYGKILILANERKALKSRIANSFTSRNLILWVCPLRFSVVETHCWKCCSMFFLQLDISRVESWPSVYRNIEGSFVCGMLGKVYSHLVKMWVIKIEKLKYSWYFITKSSRNIKMIKSWCSSLNQELIKSQICFN